MDHQKKPLKPTLCGHCYKVSFKVNLEVHLDFISLFSSFVEFCLCSAVNVCDRLPLPTCSWKNLIFYDSASPLERGARQCTPEKIRSTSYLDLGVDAEQGEEGVHVY